MKAEIVFIIEQNPINLGKPDIQINMKLIKANEDKNRPKDTSLIGQNPKYFRDHFCIKPINILSHFQLVSYRKLIIKIGQ